jgi:hypothetical protein
MAADERRVTAAAVPPALAEGMPRVSAGVTRPASEVVIPRQAGTAVAGRMVAADPTVVVGHTAVATVKRYSGRALD